MIYKKKESHKPLLFYFIPIVVSNLLLTLYFMTATSSSEVSSLPLLPNYAEVNLEMSLRVPFQQYQKVQITNLKRSFTKNNIYLVSLQNEQNAMDLTQEKVTQMLTVYAPIEDIEFLSRQKDLQVFPWNSPIPISPNQKSEGHHEIIY